MARSTATPGDYVASPPALAVGSMIVERRDEIRRAELELERLVGEYRGAATDRASTEVVDVVHGSRRSLSASPSSSAAPATRCSPW